MRPVDHFTRKLRIREIPVVAKSWYLELVCTLVVKLTVVSGTYGM
jgi:hypothetical protein